VSDEQIRDLANYPSSNAYSDLEKAVLRFAEEWTRGSKASADVVERLKKDLKPSELVVLAATVGLANWTNRFNETFAVALP
jgi:alkylhydroperoxidase family enzyme